MNQNVAIDFLYRLGIPPAAGTLHDARPYPFVPEAPAVETPPKGAKPISLTALNNRINYVHFIGGTVQGFLRHQHTGETVVVKARPEPCTGDALACSWSGYGLPADLRAYRLLALAVEDGYARILAPAQFLRWDEEGFTARLPETSYHVERRRTGRYPCSGVRAELSQGGLSAWGELVDFTPFGFRIRVRTEPAAMMRWFDVASPATLSLSRGETRVFSSRCMYMKHNGEDEPLEMVLTPTGGSQPDKDVESRNPLQRLVPAPHLVMEHPLLGESHRFKAIELSTSALVIEEEVSEAVLVPGLVIRGASIEFSGGPKVRCDLRVEHRREIGGDVFSCRLDILDMGVHDYEALARILIGALDPMADPEADMDSDALWEFLFDTGFIYPKKYGLIHGHGREIRDTGQKVYQRHSNISAHFTCRRGRRIQAHISMVRAYERTWMIHHHASRGTDMRHSGLSVLKQLMFYLNDLHRMPSTATEYVMMFYRPENRFPARIYGEFAALVDDPEGCSVDPMAYLPYTALSLDMDLPAGWSLSEAGVRDLRSLKSAYASHSGGLLLRAMHLDDPDAAGDAALAAAYEEAGLMRRREVSALRHGDETRAVLVADRSDPGLNLSELLNNIKVLAVDQDELPWRVLSTAVSKLARTFPMKRVPVLFHPRNYVQRHNIPFEKQYTAWVLHVRKGDEFMQYMRERFRIRYRS